MENAAAMRIALADCPSLFREGMRVLLSQQACVADVIEVEKLEEVTGLLEKSACDVLLLDLQLAPDVLDWIAALAAQVPVIGITTREDPAIVLAAIRAGARAVVFKSQSLESLMQAIRDVADGRASIPTEMQHRVVDLFRAPSEQQLTRREVEVASLVARGLRNGEVAARLYISEDTIKTHLNNIFRKLKVRDRVELALFVARVGLLQPSRGGRPPRQ
jgi:DNA-binding NarL/FixJ family response regulator